jgi:hypothetical protein
MPSLMPLFQNLKLTDMSKVRYPGVTPFSSNEGDVFFGRDLDVDRLYTKILTSDTVVLHATSGTGKSSLVNAKIVPLFNADDSDYLPLVVDLSILRRSNQLTNEVVKLMQRQTATVNPDLPYLLKQKDDLWYWFKLFQSARKRSPVLQSTVDDNIPDEQPVDSKPGILLIFDQFEVIESLNYRDVKSFSKKLSHVFDDKIPKIYYEHFMAYWALRFSEVAETRKETMRAEYNEQRAFLEQPLSVKALFLVREDKFGTLSLLSDCFPDILKNEYKLLPLDKEAAKEAIERPALAKGDFATPRFKFAEKENVERTTDYLISKLANKDTLRIDPIEIQIIFQYVEGRIMEDLQKGKLLKPAEEDILFIPRDYLPSIEQILTNYYKNAWKFAQTSTNLDEEVFEKCRKEIIGKLVANNTRISTSKMVFSDKSQGILQQLDKSGIVRGNIFDGKDYYQLSHDRFIEPLIEDLSILKAKEEETEKMRVEKEARDREKKEIADRRHELNLRIKEFEVKRRLRKVLIAALILVTGFLALAIYLWATAESSKKKLEIAKKQAEEEKHYSASRALKNSNPTLSYIIASQWKDRGAVTRNFQNYLETFDASKYSYIIAGLAHISPPITAAAYSDEDSLMQVTDKNYLYYWDHHKLNRGMLGGKSYFQNREIIKEVNINRVKYFIVYHPSSSQLEITGMNTSVERRFKVDTNLVPRKALKKMVAISNDMRFISIGDKLYKYHENEFIGALPAIKRTKDQIISIFKHDSKYLLVAYESNAIFVYKTDKPSNRNTLEPLLSFRPTEEMGTGISAMALSRDDKYLFVGYSNGRIIRMNFDNIRYGDSIPEEKELKGHTGSINHLAISTDSKWLISGSDDFSAILWNVETGQRSSVLKGRDSKVNYVNFSDAGRTMITGTEDGFVYLWRKGRPSTLQLHLFSPYDFYRAGLKEYNIGKVYDTTNLQNLFSSTIHYFSNLPAKNVYPEDDEYLKILDSSIYEVKRMYASLSANPEFIKESERNKNKKWILDNYYINLVNREDELLLKTDMETELDKSRRYGKKFEVLAKTLDSRDFLNIEQAIYIGNNLSQISNYFYEASRDYKTAEKYSGLRVDLLKGFHNNFPRNELLRKELTFAYWDHSWNQLFTSDFNGTISSAQAGLRVYPNLNGINTNLALGYLLTEQFEKADEIYRNYKDSSFSQSTRRFRQSFLKDLDDIKPIVGSMNNERINKEVKRVRKFLNQ